MAKLNRAEYVLVFSLFTIVQWICFFFVVYHMKYGYQEALSENDFQTVEQTTLEQQLLLTNKFEKLFCDVLLEERRESVAPCINISLVKHDVLHDYVKMNVDNMILEEDLDCFYETKYSGAILYLGPRKDQTLKIHTAPMKRTDIMMTSLRRLHAYYNSLHRYPIFIFHEDYTKEDMHFFREQYGHPLHFVRVSFEHLPDCANRVSNEEFEKWMSKYNNPIGYRQMCRFWSGIIQNAPILSSFDYYIRLDDDTMMYNWTNYDVFQIMATTSKSYVYQLTFADAAHSTSLWNQTQRWLKSTHKKEIEYGEWLRSTYIGTAPYNNFHASRFDFWRSKEVGDLLQYLEEKECGFIKHAWGDANFHAVALMALLEEDEILRLKHFPVQHNWNFVKIISPDQDAWAFFNPDEEQKPGVLLRPPANMKQANLG